MNFEDLPRKRSGYVQESRLVTQLDQCHKKHIVLIVSKITVADLKNSTNAKVNVELALPIGLINVSSNYIGTK